MVTSIIAVTAVQAYWISSAWENKEEEFSLAVSQSLKSVSIKVQEQEISDYIFAFQQLIDSVGTPNDSNFTDVFLFMDDDISSNLTSFYAFGILEEDYNINLSEFNPALLDENIKDYKPELTIPDPYFLQPSQEDYDNGFVERYFYKRKGSTTINEISKKGFGNLNSPYYQKLKLKWKISGPLNDTPEETGIIDTNRRTIMLYQNEFTGLERYLTNLQQSAKIL